MLKHIVIYLLFVAGLISCNIKEDMSDCPGTILLDYTSYSDEILDEIDPDEQVHVYIFDREGICFKIYTYTYGELQEIDYEFKVPILYNGLQAVVWHGNNAEDYNNSTMKVGESYDDFYLRLNHTIANESFSRLPSSLWASPLEPIEYCASKSRHRIHMTRIHTRLNVNLRQRLSSNSYKELDMDDYKVTVTSKNDVYHTDYSLCEQCSVLKFTNEEELAQNTFLDWTHVGTLRISPEMKCEMKIAPVGDLDNPIEVGGTTQFDLVDYMLQQRDASLNYAPEISDQRFLDLNKVWNLDFVLESSDNGNGNVAVSLTINGWTIWLDDVDLSDERL